MKKTLLTAFAALFCALAVAQSGQSVTYTIEKTARPDSSFLVETISIPVPGSPRNQETVSYRLFRDTAELTALRNQLLSASNEAQQRANEQAARAALLRQQADAIHQAQKVAFDPAPVFKGPEQPKPAAEKPKTSTKKSRKKS